MTFPILANCKIAIIGLGYVGLPLAVEFALTKSCVKTGAALDRQVIGFDLNERRLAELNRGIDSTNEISSDRLNEAHSLSFTSDINDLSQADVFIVCVPTPIDSAKQPNFTPLISATTTVYKALKIRHEICDKTNPLVIYESTVYPGATEEICIPIIEQCNSLKLNQNFYCGYSPERINPADKFHTLPNITKVTSGSDAESAIWIDKLYSSIIKAGTFKAQSIKVAEAAKVIENTQRDLNIALINELSIIFSKLNIDTLDVLEAAGSKWNFLPFRPGLVGGHCIGVDPFYLTFKAEQLGYHPQVVLAGRRINDGMSAYIAQLFVREMIKCNKKISGSKVLILGYTFKENCPDFRNTKVEDLIDELSKFYVETTVVDPWIIPSELKEKTSLHIYSEIPENKYDGIIMAVAHDEFKTLSEEDLKILIHDNAPIFDLKGIFPRFANIVRL